MRHPPTHLLDGSLAVGDAKERVIGVSVVVDIDAFLERVVADHLEELTPVIEIRVAPDVEEQKANAARVKSGDVGAELLARRVPARKDGSHGAEFARGAAGFGSPAVITGENAVVREVSAPSLPIEQSLRVT